MLPAVVQAQSYTNQLRHLGLHDQPNATITITNYTGPGGAVTIPSTINNLPVTSIGHEAFYELPKPDQRHDPKQRHQHRGRCVRWLHA